MSCSFGLSQTEAGDGFMLGFYCKWGLHFCFERGVFESVLLTSCTFCS